MMPSYASLPTSLSARPSLPASVLLAIISFCVASKCRPGYFIGRRPKLNIRCNRPANNNESSVQLTTNPFEIKTVLGKLTTIVLLALAVNQPKQSRHHWIGRLHPTLFISVHTVIYPSGAGVAEMCQVLKYLTYCLAPAYLHAAVEFRKSQKWEYLGSPSG